MNKEKELSYCSVGIILLALLLLQHGKLSCPVITALVVLHGNLVFALVPEILDGQLACPSQALNITNPVQGALEVLVKSFPRTDISECMLHGHGIGANHSARINGKEIIMVVALDEIGASHYLPGFV